MGKSKARRAIGAALSAICLWSAAAHAASENGQFAVRGIGNQDCTAFTQGFSKRSQGTLMFAGWLDGYISAFNRLQPRTFDAAPWQLTDILMVLINNHCAANPRAQLFGVVQALLEFYTDQRLTTGSPRVGAAAGDKKLTVYQEVMRRAQTAMVKAGVYSGTPDGLYGPVTKAAFEAFQESRDLPKTGLPDQQTLYHLFGRE